MNTGAILEDYRLESEKAKDFNADELGLGTKSVFKEIDIENYLHPALKRVKEQGDSTCGSHTISNILQVSEYQETGRTELLSASYPYQKRLGGYVGTSVSDVMTTLRKFGTTYELFMPSDKVSDQNVLSMPSTDTDHAIGQILSCASTFQINSFDEMVQYMESGRKNGVASPVAILLSFNVEDWRMIVQDKGNYKPFGHWITGVNYGLVNGEEGIVIADSFLRSTANPNGYRFLPKSYFRNVRAMVGMTDRNNVLGGEIVGSTDKPTFKLKEWKMGDTDAQELQKFLKWIGTFPLTQNETGLYGSVTRKAVKDFQTKYKVASQATIEKFDGKFFSKGSIKKANELLK